MTQKIGVLFLQAQAGFGADAAVHADIMRNLDRERFSVHLACTDGGGEGEPASLRILRELPNVALRPTRFAPSIGRIDAESVLHAARSARDFSRDFLSLRKYVQREGIRIIHSTERPRDSSYNLVLSKLTGARSIVHVHVKWSEAYSRLAKWSVAHTDGVIGVSRYVASTIAAMGKPRARIHTVLNGIDPTKWNPELDAGALRDELGVPREALVLASVSRLFVWKGQRELLKAFARLRAEIPNLYLLIVGADSAEAHTGSFSDELKALARELEVEKHVVFTGERSDIPAVMAACDLYTMPSFEEPFGLVFAEAMAMRKPVVAVNNGGTPEVVEHGQTGLLSEPWDIDGLTTNIRTLLGDADLRARMGERARSEVLRRFTAQRVAKDAAAVYERVLAGLPSREHQ